VIFADIGKNFGAPDFVIFADIGKNSKAKITKIQ
jgi:hypothetical protein